MIVRPELQALRSDDAPQRRAQAHLGRVLDAWLSRPEVAALDAELARYGAGAELEDQPLLCGLFAEDDPSGAALVEDIVAIMLGELANDQLGQIPLRFFTDDVLTSLQLRRAGACVLTLQAIDGPRLARRPRPLSASYSASETWEKVLAGSARGERIALAQVHARSAELLREPFRVSAGQVLHRFGSHEVLQFDQVPGWLVSLKLQRRHAGAAVASEYLLDSGELVHQSAASPRDSRLELSAELLGRMGRRDAAPLLAAMAEEIGGASMRWQALRECLGLDSGTGFAALCRIAADPADPLAAPAGALRAQLLETYPALASAVPLGGAVPCPA